MPMHDAGKLIVVRTYECARIECVCTSAGSIHLGINHQILETYDKVRQLHGTEVDFRSLYI